MRAIGMLSALALGSPAFADPAIRIQLQERVIAGGTLSVAVDADGHAPANFVGLVASRRRGAGPCGPTGACLRLQGPYTQLDMRQSAPQAPYAVNFQLPPGLPAGATIYVQGAVADQNGLAAVSNVIEVLVEPPRPGCTDPTAENYAPRFNIDDGSCRCQDMIVVSTAAELAQHTTCTRFGELVLDDYVDDEVDLPVLEIAESIVVRGSAPQLTTVSAPVLRSLVGLHLRDNPLLSTVELPALTRLAYLTVDGAAPAGWWPVPSLTQVGQYELQRTSELVISLPIRPLDVVAVESASSLRAVFLPPGNRAIAMTVVGDTSPVLTLDAGGPLFSVYVAEVTADSVNVTGADEITVLDLSYAPFVRVLELPTTVAMSELVLLDNQALERVIMPALQSVDLLDIDLNPWLSYVEAPSLSAITIYGGIYGNPLWCVTDVPFFAGLAPGGVVDTSGNLCDL